MILTNPDFDYHKWIQSPRGQFQINRAATILSHAAYGSAIQSGRHHDFHSGVMDKHLPGRENIEVELADLIIRVFSFSGAMGFDVVGALAEKMLVNTDRPDHQPENHEKGGGK